MEEYRKQNYVRILKIELENFKNVTYGEVEFSTSHAVKKHGVGIGRDVLGIYGQNGSGKTALVEALKVWQLVMTGENIPESLQALLKDHTRIFLSFLLCDKDAAYQVEHEIILTRSLPEKVSEQNFHYRVWEEDRWSRKRIMRPQKKAPVEKLFRVLYHYAAHGLWIVTAGQLGRIHLNMGKTIELNYQDESQMPEEEQRISLFEENKVMPSEMVRVRRMVQQLNIVMQAILPGFQIRLSETCEEEMIRFSFLANRYETDFPLSNESSGMKRILSLLTILIAGYNSLSLCVVVDEVDAGIFEYLLGELLEMMKNGAKGQFLFTSHNLRALEVLGKNHIIFSTSNPENRYIRFSRLPKNKNLRDEYFRSILLGGQDEPIYEEADSYELGYAFRKAGKLYDES